MDDREGPGPSYPPSARVRRRVVGRTVVALLGAALLATGWHWWTHPSLFGDYAGGSLLSDPVLREELPFYVGVGLPARGTDSEVITLEGARAQFAPNTAGARGTSEVCTRREVAEGSLTLGFVRADDAPEEYCTELRPVRPGTPMVYDGTSTQYLVLTITATRPGTAELAAVELQPRLGSPAPARHPAAAAGPHHPGAMSEGAPSQAVLAVGRAVPLPTTPDGHGQGVD